MTIATFEEVALSRPGLAHLVVASLRAHVLPLCLTVLIWAVIYVTVTAVPGHREIDFASFAAMFVMATMPTLLLAVTVIRFLHLAVHVRPKHPLIALVRDLAGFFAEPRRIATGIPMVIGLSLLMEGFNRLKFNIPVIRPFAWDGTFTDLDRWLHFGRLPWEWLQPVLGHPLVTVALNVNYNMWFMVMWCMWVLLAFMPVPSELRMRFFLSFILAWTLGGGVAALALSSAGPVYYAAIGHAPDPYAPLLAYLNRVGETWPLWALDTQQLLWDAHTGKQNVIGGISAMPSMHNASALLFALAGWKLGRGAGLALTAFAVLIFLGSVHLAWHYAADAYLGWAIALLVWWICGPVARWNQDRQWTRSYLTLLENRAAR